MTHRFITPFLFLVAIVFLTVVSCKKDTAPVDFHFDYFPIQKGHFVTYSSHEVYTDTNEIITSYRYDYFIKALVGDTFIDNEGRIARRYERYTSDFQNGPWVLRDIWTVYLNGNKLELIEENNRIIKLVLAPSKIKEWNAHAYTTLPELNCYYTNIHLPFSLNAIDYDSTVTVEQENTFNLIQYKRKFERYAKGVGLVHKHFKDFEIKNFDSTVVYKGVEQILKAVDYGVE